MSTWKDEMDRKFQAQVAAEEKHKDEMGENSRQESARNREFQLREFQKKFRCQICGKPASGPEKARDYSTNTILDGLITSRSVDPTLHEDWSKPADLQRCSVCKNWICDDHIHRGVCKKDYEEGRA